MQIPLSDAIQQLRDELREAILEGKDKDIVFTPNGIDIELAINFKAEAKGEGKVKLLALLDLSTGATASRESQHKIKLSLSVADKDGNPLKVRSDAVRSGLPQTGAATPQGQAPGAKRQAESRQ
jgi:Trypsin-co-occurring domain 2